MILKIWDDFSQQEGWLYVDHVLSAKVEASTYVLTKDSAKEGDGSPRHVHDENAGKHYRLGLHTLNREARSDGLLVASFPNREVEFHGGKLLLNWQYLIQDYKIDGDDHIGVKLILVVFDVKDGRESETYIILKGQDAYLLSDTGKTIEKI